jgi:hypothetical protein
MEFRIVGRIVDVKIIASGTAFRVQTPVRLYGKGRWRKLKGIATVGSGVGGEDLDGPEL